jgi:hypothetical protein
VGQFPILHQASLGKLHRAHNPGDARSNKGPMLSPLAILLCFFTAAAGATQSTDTAATLLSRYPVGAMPNSPGVLKAIGTLAESGDPDVLPLLESLVSEETSEVRGCALAAIESISRHAALANRSAYQPPRASDVSDWLSHHMPMGPDDEALGRHERRAVAYAALVLGDSAGPYTADWSAIGSALEAEGKTRAALRVYSAAIINGHFEAIAELDGFKVDTETFLLGLLTALPKQHPTHGPLWAWLVETGSVSTIRVISDRSLRLPALDRALSLDALSQMIRAGRLSSRATSIARRHLEAGAHDPHTDVSTFARSTLIELANH